MNFTIYSGPACAWCTRAKQLLKDKNIPFEEKGVPELKERMPSARTIPQVFVGDQHIGGYEDLVKFLNDGPHNNS
jgi:glutaredoxin 3